MSGDVQPRKRKDKKRKKDESTEQIPTKPQIPIIDLNEDVNIHVHKEDGTGGGICAKIIFFLLFSALAVLIGLIITEHRGLTDLDTVDQESRFSQLFEGWIDNNIHDDHDDEGDHIASSLEDHDHEEDEADHDDQHDEEDEHEEEEDEEEHEDEEELSEEVSQGKDEGSVDEDEDDDEEEEETAEDEEQPLESEEQEEENEDESELKEADEDEVSEEVDEEQDVSKDVEDDTHEGDEEEETPDDDEPENVSKEEESQEAEQSQEKGSEEAPEEEPSSQGEEGEEETEDREVEKAEEETENEDANNSKMVVKIGVGVALLVVAHVVLVRKWKSAETSEKEEPIPDLSRRNTIVVPPPVQEIEQDIEDNVEEEYSDEDGEIESEEEHLEQKSVKAKYQELRTTYTRSLTPDSEPEYQTKPADDEEEYEEDEEEEDDEEEEEEEEEEDESDGGEYEKEDDEELLKRLEAKYGKLRDGNQEEDKNEEYDEQFSSWKRVNVRADDNEPEESDSDKQSDVDTYEYENITNKADFPVKEQIDEAQKAVKDNAAYAIKLFDVLLQNYSSSPRSLYGKAQALDVLAEQKRSNEILQKAIIFYLKVLELEDVPDPLFEAAAERCINRMRFIGNYNRAIDVHNKLIKRFPQSIKHRNQLVVSYLTINKVNRARMVLKETLLKHPNDGFALVHYGFILKTSDNNLHESVSYLRRGIATKEPGVIDGRFYFHLGDALARLGRNEEAIKIYEEGVQHKLFLSKYQRSLYNVARLKGQPWWSKEETPYASLYSALESNWKQIRDEGLSVLSKNGLFQQESENLKDTGDWKQFELFARGQKNAKNCQKCPVTCKIIESVPDAKGCRRGQTKFSVMHPGTHVWPHCGPTNCRLRVHLGLKVPANTYIRVANEVRSWEDGKVIIFDDSFEHEVWHNGTTFRLVLIVDVWHPELTTTEKRSLSPI